MVEIASANGTAVRNSGQNPGIWLVTRPSTRLAHESAITIARCDPLLSAYMAASGVTMKRMKNGAPVTAAISCGERPRQSSHTGK